MNWHQILRTWFHTISVDIKYFSLANWESTHISHVLFCCCVCYAYKVPTSPLLPNHGIFRQLSNILRFIKFRIIIYSILFYFFSPIPNEKPWWLKGAISERSYSLNAAAAVVAIVAAHIFYFFFTLLSSTSNSFIIE